MKIILLQDVKSLGKKGDVVDVSDGYARNMLLPRKLGVEANKGNLNSLRVQNAHAEKRANEDLATAKELAEKLEGVTVIVGVKAGEKGRVFGSVSAKEIAEAANAQFGLTIDKKKLQMDGTIKEVGEREVVLKLHPQVAARLKIDVRAES